MDLFPSIQLLHRRCLLLVSVALTLALCGCAASTQLIRNDKVSTETKAKGFSNYKEVLFIPPKPDPRNVTPRAVAEMEAMGFTVRVMNPDKPLEPDQGTAFLIGDGSFALTCAHVLSEEKEATLTIEGKRYFADVVKSEKEVDLALLKLREKLPPAAAPLSFRGSARDYSMGEDVFTIGYPLSRMLGNSARMTKGLLSATSGLRDDPKQVQVSAEIQPGNSGGPLLDRDGQIIGVIQKTINPWKIAEVTGGALPQNINFSIKNAPVLEFVKGASPEAFASIGFDKAGSLDKAAHGVAKVQAGLVKDEGDRSAKLVVKLGYVSIWDIWYRFRFFAISAYDFDTQERLFTAGQGRDNMISNEDVVIRDTFGQFRKAMESR